MTAKVSITNVEPNTSDFGISGSQVIVNQVSGELYTRTLNNQVKRIGADSAFVQSGAGALAGNVSAQLQKFGFLSDFDTAGNYQTFRDALTGTMAVPNLYVNGTLTGTGVVRLGDGSAAAPALAPTSAPTSGMYKGAFGVSFSQSGNAGVALGGGIQVGSAGVFQWANAASADTPSGADVILSRDVANVLALKGTTNTAAAFRYFAGNGSFGALVSFNESLTIAAAATTDSATTIPAGAIILAASVRVTTVIPTAATFTVTTATGGTTLNTAAVSVAATSTDLGTAAGALYTSAGTKIRITPNLTPGAATGVVRICGYYFLPLAPTS